MTPEEKNSIYEDALNRIASITNIETPLDKSAEVFFFVAAKMRKIARQALDLTDQIFLDKVKEKLLIESKTIVTLDNEVEK